MYEWWGTTNVWGFVGLSTPSHPELHTCASLLCNYCTAKLTFDPGISPRTKPPSLGGCHAGASEKSHPAVAVPSEIGPSSLVRNVAVLLVRAGGSSVIEAGQLIPPDEGLLERIHGEDHSQMTNATPRSLLVQTSKPSHARYCPFQTAAVAGIRMAALLYFTLLRFAYPNLYRTCGIESRGMRVVAAVGSLQCAKRGPSRPLGGVVASDPYVRECAGRPDVGV